MQCLNSGHIFHVVLQKWYLYNFNYTIGVALFENLTDMFPREILESFPYSYLAVPFILFSNVL